MGDKQCEHVWWFVGVIDELTGGYLVYKCRYCNRTKEVEVG